MLEVKEIVLTLEHQDSALCERLDSLGLTILCSIFIYSQECTAQQRGLYLLAVSQPTTYSATITDNIQKALHRNKLESAQKLAQKQDKKMALGQAALTLLIKRFLKTDSSEKLRRWAGIFLPSQWTLANILASLGYLLWNFSQTALKIQRGCDQVHLMRNIG